MFGDAISEPPRMDGKWIQNKSQYALIVDLPQIFLTGGQRRSYHWEGGRHLILIWKG